MQVKVMQDITGEVLAKLAADVSYAKRLNSAFSLGMFRVVLLADDSYSFEDLCGSTFDPLANPEVEVTTLARQKRTFRARVNREGVFGAVIQGRSLPSVEWVDIDSCWGFVGDDFIGSGYEIGFMSTANDWLVSNLDYPTIKNLFIDLIK